LCQAPAGALRLAPGMAALWGVAAGLAPLRRARCEARFGNRTLFVYGAALWPVRGFRLSFELFASRETVPFLYFQV
ncbi:MBOAT family protein, partial [Pseudomonas syringae]